MNQRIKFLVHTRSKSFDYSWIYGFQDAEEQRKLENFLLKWLAVNQLANIPPVSAFFKFDNKYFILMARQSPHRVDQSGRPIFERALFSWESHGAFTYADIDNLYHLLLNRASDAVENIPNDEIRAPRAIKDLELDLAELPQADKSGTEWGLPFELTWRDISANRLVVKTPSLWGFSRILRPILNIKFSFDNVLCIGSSLPLNCRIENGSGWIISPPHSEMADDQVLIMDERGEILSGDKVSRLKGHLDELSAKDSAPPVDSKPVKSEARNKELKGMPPLPDQFFDNAANVDKMISSSRKEGTGDWIVRSFGFGKGEQMREALVRLSLLLSPVHLAAGADLGLAWINLLAEISLCYKDCSQDVGRHWLQRLQQLEKISLSACRSHTRNWEREFKAACQNISDLIGLKG